MISEAALLESRSLRDGVVDRTHVIDKVKTLSLLPDGMHVTTAMVATYFEVTETVIRAMVFDHREELESNGYRVLTGSELSYFKQLSGIQSRTASLALFPQRAVLNVAMLLRDSEVARQVRTYLLDTEYAARTQPVDNPVHSPSADLDDRIDGRITHILGKTVVPMLNALIETSGEQRRDLISARADIHRVQRKLAQHEQRLHRLERTREQRPLAGVMASIDAMNWREFEQHIASLLRRDSCTGVEIHGGSGDRGADITAYTADGRRLVVQCKNFAPYRSVWSGEMQKFVGTKTLHQADVAVYVATCPFSREALDIALQVGVTVVHRGLLEAWSAGAKLQVLR
ncbi:restriction endonuclease [Streptomyces sp. NBC_01318]|uniref:restriction endonuclease n=1 Tax=unclassified Streptomyces TaxID=2593676 RepID=UPI002E0D8B34|nr:MULTISPECIES: restriction endonuclease [unclassified Streptomyces]WSJ52193.1 restriction endonuclease [Streptomyces sp. NBC_01318]